jgi:hypothetical protein
LDSWAAGSASATGGGGAAATGGGGSGCGGGRCGVDQLKDKACALLGIPKDTPLLLQQTLPRTNSDDGGGGGNGGDGNTGNGPAAPGATILSQVRDVQALQHGAMVIATPLLTVPVEIRCVSPHAGDRFAYYVPANQARNPTRKLNRQARWINGG